MFKKILKGGSGVATPQAGGSSSMGGGKGGGMAAKAFKEIGDIKSGTGGGGQVQEILDKLPPEERAKILRQLGMTGVKKGGKVSKAKAKSKPMPVKPKAKKTVKKQSGHNRLY
jgi:hypothetical protein